MPGTRFTVHTTLTPHEAMAVITDFGPDRAKNWPNVSDSLFELHDQGDGWAEVTEGTSMGWERERYTWDVEAGTVTIDTLESNLWAPGSGWRYALTPGADGGTDVEIALVRHAASWQGRIIGALVPVAGPLALAKQFRTVFRRAEAGSGS